MTANPETHSDGPVASILLVDDQPSRLLTYEAILQDLYVTCVRANSGEEALALLLRQEFAAIVLDVHMPGMNGFETARLIREHPRLRHTPIIFATGVHVDELDELHGYELGAIDYISVPIVPQILRSKVATLIELWNRGAELARINRDLDAARLSLEAERNEAIAAKVQLLREREELYRAIFEHPTELTVVMEAVRDTAGQVIDWRYRDANRNACALLGRAREELVGKTLGEVLPDRAQRVSWLCARTLETREPYRLESFFAGRHFLTCLFPIGESTIVSSGVDITARVQAAQAIEHQAELSRAEKEWFAAVLNSMTEEVYFTDPEGRYTYANPAALREFEHAAIAGVPVAEIVSKLEVLRPDGSVRPLSEAPPLRALGGEVVRDEEQMVRIPRTGELRHRQVSSAPVHDAQGAIIGAVSVVRDITERKRNEEALRINEQRLREAARRKDEFLAVLAHELRNPLAAIAAGSALLARPGQKTEVIDLARDSLQRQVDHMTRLLDELLDVARITNGLVQLRLEQVDLAQTVRAAVTTIQPQLESKRHHIKVIIADEPVHVRGDAVRLAQVIGNLLSNAAKYTAPGGHIEVALRTEQDSAVIAVRDDGIGIPAAMLSRVFEMFTQVKRTQSAQAGLGIGLALVQGLTQLHGGTIEAHSEGEGKGSEFVITLPLARAEASAGSGQPSHPGRIVRPRRILVADDNRDNALNWALLLEQEGHTVRVVFDGRAATEEAERFRPEVALLDIGMPELSGYEVARAIRASERGRSMTLVAITGWGQGRDKDQAKSAGFDHHLTKPASLDDIRDILVGIDA